MRGSMIGPGLALSIGLFGVLLGILPGSAGWEEDIGLDLLFRLRGPQATPPEVALILLNSNSGRRLGLSDEITRWPRSVYVRLLERLHRAGAAVIVFDIFFKRPQVLEQDQELATAIRRAGNVILVGYLEKEALDVPATSLGKVEIERLRYPVQALAEAAVVVAPFVLPKVPVKVSRFWTFHGPHELASLPAAALELYAQAQGPDLQPLLQRADPERFGPAVNARQGNRLVRGIPDMRTLLHKDARLRNSLQQSLRSSTGTVIAGDQLRVLRALFGLYEEPVYPYLNFYGPPGTLDSIPLYEVLNGTSDLSARLHGKAVFVGYADRYQPKQKDGFYTVFSQPDGVDLSGVEIAATAFANLLRQETIRPLGFAAGLVLLLAYGVVLTLLLRLLPGLRGIALGLLAASGYFLLTYGLFSRVHIWLPWVIPLGLQTPLAILGVTVWHYREAHLGRQRLRHAFGYYLPDAVVDRLAEEAGPALVAGESGFGVCLASDAEQYTQLAETMSPEALQPLLNRYYERLFQPVRARGGTISDVVGDAMMAIWSASGPDASIRHKACEAALEIHRSIAGAEERSMLHTRIGLHAGQLVMSHVGAMDHYEYRAVGDMVNTAARIENLNKRLQTAVLASEAVVEGLDGFIVRDLGSFHLKGKRQAMKIFEIVARAGDINAEAERLLERFALALAVWQEGDRRAARLAFQALHEDYPADGPTGYYLSLVTTKAISDRPADGA
jgi:adenylate cyclase